MSQGDLSRDDPSPFSSQDYDSAQLPDHDNDFVDETDIAAFVQALSAPEDPLKSPTLTPSSHKSAEFITALNDWRPIRQRVRKDQPKTRRKKRKKPRRGKDETREGHVYTVLKWPLLLFVLTWIVCLAAAYAVTRLYIWAYESGVTMRGRRETLRKKLYEAKNYEQWVRAARRMDTYLDNDKWKEDDEYAYYNSGTIHTVRNELRRLRAALENRGDNTAVEQNREAQNLAHELRALLEASVKDNFVGVENTRLYSETYYGTKNLVQSFLAEVSASLELLSNTPYLSTEAKSSFFSHLSNNYGRVALCLSGGATFAYYHFGVAKALLDNNVLPKIITGTSGGALVAALLATRTDDELKGVLKPALAHRITACSEPYSTRTRRWWRTGAQFDSVDWARACSWFCHGNLTFLEAYQRTGRILNVTCIPSDPHSPAVLANYLTSPDCVIWSAVMASAAVPGILNPVVLMRKNDQTGTLEPYSFGHKWKDGSLRTDIPLKALNTNFNVTYSIVSQVNPHINLFFFSSRGTVGRPVTHRRGRGWRGGFLGSATEQYLKLDLYKWLKVIRHLELLPRYAEQDWSNIWLQRFDGTITIWPKSRMSDFRYILSDPSPERLARMLWTGMQSAWPKIKFVQNRYLIENAIHEGLERYPPANGDALRINTHTFETDTDTLPVPSILSEEDLQSLLQQARKTDSHSMTKPALGKTSAMSPIGLGTTASPSKREPSPSFAQRIGRWWPSSPTLRARNHVKRHSWTPTPAPLEIPNDTGLNAPASQAAMSRRGSFMKELGRQSMVFVDDTEAGEGTGSDFSEEDEGVTDESEKEAEDMHQGDTEARVNADGDSVDDVVDERGRS